MLTLQTLDQKYLCWLLAPSSFLSVCVCIILSQIKAAVLVLHVLGPEESVFHGLLHLPLFSHSFRAGTLQRDDPCEVKGFCESIGQASPSAALHLVNQISYLHLHR